MLQFLSDPIILLQNVFFLFTNSFIKFLAKSSKKAQKSKNDILNLFSFPIRPTYYILLQQHFPPFLIWLMQFTSFPLHFKLYKFLKGLKTDHQDLFFKELTITQNTLFSYNEKSKIHLWDKIQILNFIQHVK